MKRLMWSNLILGLWLMISPFVLALLNGQAFQLLWEDLLLGFGIATFSLCRLVSRSSEQIAVADWLITALAVITLINPILYGYYGIRAAAWNNLVLGAAALILAGYQDWKDSGHSALRSHRHQAH